MAVQEIPKIHADLNATFRTGKTKPMAWRRAQLKALKKLHLENEQALCQALKADLGKSDFEGWGAEILVTCNEIDHTLQHMNEWARPERIPTPVAVQPASSEIRRDPLGTVLIIAPWNYPLQLCLAPLVPALAAGNCAVLKPSELAPATSKIIAKLVPKYLDPDAIAVVEGGVPTSTELLEHKWDHILFTGGGNVGRIVMAAAAKHLTPVTLELGGKSPCIVGKKTKIGQAARRIIWGKVYNAGQTCIAPDYILVHSSRKDELMAAFERALKRFHGDDAQKSADYGRIINERHFDRLVGLLGDHKVLFGGTHDRDDKFIAPTILDAPDLDSPVMTEEIFGPLLPVHTYETMDEAIKFVNDRDKPLALYLFSTDAKERERVLNETSSGGVCVNQTILHYIVNDGPFGGVGPSGMGAYHGKWGFETFSHRKTVMTRTTLVDPDILYPPYSETKKKWTRRLA
ncbi:MAG: aldehyde dehydrogenase family protein [Proteobacteria bacterium]|nr:aldehyde dehydrogenase family protein [Pseudomonadota bacterium]